MPCSESKLEYTDEDIKEAKSYYYYEFINQNVSDYHRKQNIDTLNYFDDLVSYNNGKTLQEIAYDNDWDYNNMYEKIKRAENRVIIYLKMKGAGRV